MHWAVQKFRTEWYMLLYSFDEWTNIRMYMYVVVLNQNTPVVGKTILEPRLEEGGQQVFSSLQARNRNFVKQLGGEQMFFNIRFQFQDPPGGNK